MSARRLVLVARGAPGGQYSSTGPAELVLVDGTPEVPWTVDLGAGTISMGEVSGALIGFTALTVPHREVWSSLAVRGTDGDDTVDLVHHDAVGLDGPVELDLGAGDDQVRVPRVANSALLGGAGTDSLALSGYAEGLGSASVTVDLDGGSLRDDARGASAVAGFEDLHLDQFVRSRVIATSRANRITVIGCAVAIDARAGSDLVRVYRQLGCRNRVGDASGATIRLGAGDDVGSGTPYDDVILGGPGRDRADGGNGQDRCQTEVRKSC